MPTPVEQEIRNKLTDFEAVFFQVVRRAWEKWWANPDRSRLNRRTRATLIHNYMMIEAAELLSPLSGVHAIEKHESTIFMIKSSVLARFKKGDDRGLTSNIPTQAAIAFNDPQAPLLDLPDLSRIDIAYVLNTFETQIQDILVVARNCNNVLWSYSINGAGGAAVVNMPNTPNNLPPADKNMKAPGAIIEKEKGSSEE